MNIRSCVAIGTLLSLVLTGCAGGGDGGGTTADTAQTSDPESADSRGPDDEGSDSADVASEPSGEPIIIGVPVELTGGVARLGQEIEYSVQLAIEHINEVGGVLGRPLEAVVVDTTDEPAAALSAMQNIQRQDPVAIMGPLTSYIVQPSVNFADEVGIPFLHGTGGPSLSADEDGSEWFFRLRVNDRVTASALSEFAVNELNVGSVAIHHDRLPNGIGFLEQIVEQFESAGVDVVGTAGHDLDVRDFTPQIRETLANDPEALIVMGFPADTAVLYRQLIEQGLGDTQVLTNVAPINAAFLFGLIEPTDLQDGLIATVDSWPMGSQNKDVRDLAVEFESRFGIMPTEIMGSFYSGTLLLAAAIEEAGSTEPEAISAALTSIEDFTEWRGLTTLDVPLSCDPVSHDCAHSRLIVEVSDGNLEVIDSYISQP